MKVGVLDHFDSMHFLPGHPKCGVPHGHTYKVEVSLDGPVVDGMVIDFDRLKSVLREILQGFDHGDLNGRLPYPSCENIAREIHEQLRGRLDSGALTVRIWEGEGKWAEYSG